MKTETKHKYFAIGYVFVILQLVNFAFWVFNSSIYNKYLGILLGIIPAIILIIKFNKTDIFESIINDRSMEKHFISIISLNLTITLATQLFYWFGYEIINVLTYFI